LRNDTLIESLEINGQYNNNINEIISHCRSFYSDLLNSQPTDKTQWSALSDTLSVLSREDAESCEGPYTYSECWRAICQMANDKSPGSDGLPAEFYKAFFPEFGHIFVSIANSQYQHELALSQRLGIINLLPKKNGDLHFLANWRPISLLNVDYKILSKSLVNRLKLVAAKIIGPSQSAAVPNRSIFDALHLLRNVFYYCKERNIPCLALSLDQAKAFDRVEHDYLFYIMEKMGIGTDFISKVKQLYNNIFSQVLVNGFLTTAFSVTRSVRQGCSLSPLLFVIAIEPLLNLIRQSLIFKGIPIPGRVGEERVVCYADDTTALVQNEASVKEVLALFDKYSRASGAQLNISKSTALVINGKFYNALLPSSLQITDTAKICGIFFGAQAGPKNEELLRTNITNSIQGLTGLTYTYHGKAQAFNFFFFLTKLWYLVTIFDLSVSFLSWVETKAFRMIWGPMERIRRSVAYNIYTGGGLGIFHVPSRIAAFRVKHLATFISCREKPWVAFADYWIAISMRNFLPNVSLNSSPHAANGPQEFYKHAIHHLHSFLDAGGSLTNSPSLTRIAYRIFLASIVTPPKCMGIATTDRIAVWRKLKSGNISPLPKNMLWQISHGILPVKSFLLHRKVINDDLCPMCSNAVEDVSHRFFDCTVNSKFWELFRRVFPYIASLSPTQMFDLEFGLLPSLQRGAVIPLSEGLYTLWTARNEVTFQRRHHNTDSICALFRRRLKIRLRAERARLDRQRFADLWLDDWWWREHNGIIDILF
jgi:hypothetical protein